jgi:hypothetical protein
LSSGPAEVLPAEHPATTAAMDARIDQRVRDDENVRMEKPSAGSP